MARKTKYDYYDDSFKVTAVALAAMPGTYAADVAEILDIHPVMLYRWKKECRDGIIMDKTKKSTLDTSTTQELKRLQAIEKEHEILKMKHDLLKKSIQYCSDLKKKSSPS